MFKRIFALVTAAALALGLAGCGAAPAADTAPDEGQTAAGEVYVADTPLRVAGLKGPTTMGLLNLVEASAAGADVGSLEFSMYGMADEVAQLLIKGELDAAAIPANLAATLSQKTDIVVACVNTLGVLYVVERGDSIQSVADLKGATILSTGKGTTPEYVLRYVLQQNGIDPDNDVTIEYLSEATEVVTRLTELSADSRTAVAMLPQPFVTSAVAQSEGALRVALDMTEEWQKVAGSQLVTGVLAARKDAIEADPARFEQFLKDYQDSVNYANTELETTAALCEKYDIIPQVALAEKALPACNIVFVTGEEMKQDLVNYFNVLLAADPTSVGGALPGDDFYYGV